MTDTYAVVEFSELRYNASDEYDIVNLSQLVASRTALDLRETPRKFIVTNGEGEQVVLRLYGTTVDGCLSVYHTESVEGETLANIERLFLADI